MDPSTAFAIAGLVLAACAAAYFYAKYQRQKARADRVRSAAAQLYASLRHLAADPASAGVICDSMKPFSQMFLSMAPTLENHRAIYEGIRRAQAHCLNGSTGRFVAVGKAIGHLGESFDEPVDA